MCNNAHVHLATDERLTGIDERLAKLESWLANIDAAVISGHSPLTEKLEAIFGTTNRKFGVVHDRIDALKSRLERMGHCLLLRISDE